MQLINAAPQQNSFINHVALSEFRTTPAGWLTRVFGCWHREMSRPFTMGDETYCVCLDCGAQRRFNLESWEMTGPYYYSTPLPTQGAYEAAGVGDSATYDDQQAALLMTVA